MPGPDERSSAEVGKPVVRCARASKGLADSPGQTRAVRRGDLFADARQPADRYEVAGKDAQLGSENIRWT
jgi:hypothetical protein